MTSIIRTSAADVNLLSVSNNIWGTNEGSTAAITLPSQPSPLQDALDTITPQSYSSILKIADGTHDLDLPETGYLDIAQGAENVVDFNNQVTNVTLHAHFGVGGGQGDQIVTVKGGCSNIKLNGFIYSTGRNADVVLDAWSDQSSALVSGIDLSGLARVDGQPVTIILGRFGSKIDHYPVSYRVLWWKSLCYKVYYLAKAAAVKLHLIKGVS